MNHKAVGEISEAVVIAELVKAGKTVLVPFGDNKRYDVAIDENGKLVRVQVKTAWLKDGCLQFNVASCNPYTNVRKDYTTGADIFAIYDPSSDKVYWVPVKAAPKTSMMLRLEKPKKFSPKINFAKDFEVLPY